MGGQKGLNVKRQENQQEYLGDLFQSRGGLVCQLVGGEQVEVCGRIKKDRREKLGLKLRQVYLYEETGDYQDEIYYVWDDYVVDVHRDKLLFSVNFGAELILDLVLHLDQFVHVDSKMVFLHDSNIKSSDCVGSFGLLLSW